MAFPNTIVARSALHNPINNFATVLLASVNAVQTSIPIAVKQIGSVALPASGMVSIGKEVIYYQSINPTGPQLVNCIRGFDNTIAAPHSTGERVEVRWVAAHHNALADLLYTVQVVLGADILNGEDQRGDDATYVSLAAKLRGTLPLVQGFGPSTTWSATHTRKRVVGVQLYELIDGKYNLFEAPVIQTVDSTGPGASTVTIEPFAVAKAGAMVML